MSWEETSCPSSGFSWGRGARVDRAVQDDRTGSGFQDETAAPRRNRRSVPLDRLRQSGADRQVPALLRARAMLELGAATQKVVLRSDRAFPDTIAAELGLGEARKEPVLERVAQQRGAVEATLDVSHSPRAIHLEEKERRRGRRLLLSSLISDGNHSPRVFQENGTSRSVLSPQSELQHLIRRNPKCKSPQRTYDSRRSRTLGCRGPWVARNLSS